jgi:endonuclease-3
MAEGGRQRGQRRIPGAGPTADATVAAMFDRLSAVITPRCELDFANPYELLVAVVLSAQCTDVLVNRATAKLFPVARTPAAMVALGTIGIEPLIRSIGLFRAKARSLVGLSAQLIERHGGEVPRDRAALEALPGVGRKTAGVVLNVAFGQPTIPVDTHVFRIANRLGIARTRTPEATEPVLEARVPERHRRHAHAYLILHGRYTCTARAPRCTGCPLVGICPRIGVAATGRELRR